MNEIVNKLLLVGDKFMPDMNLRQLQFTYRIYATFTKSKERIQKLKKQGIHDKFIKKELDKACFQHDMAY